MHLLALSRRVHFRPKVCSGAASGGEESGEDWLDNRSEDNLGSVGHRQCHPEDKDELEDVVKWEPVDGVDQALKDVQEGVYDPVRQPLRVVYFIRAEQSIQGIVSGNNEASEVDQKLSTNIEEDEEEVQSCKAK